MTAPDVDVVIVSWNTRDDLLCCIGSATGSTAVAANIIVVDNASRDGSADAVAARFPQATLIRNAENEGFARAVNRGVAAGTAPLVLLLNPDALLPPGALAALIRTLERTPRCGAVAPRLCGEDGAPQQSAFPAPSIGLSLLIGLGLDRLLPGAMRSRLLLPGAWRSDVERDVPWVIGAVLLTRRETLESVGGLDERFFVYAEDLEWCDRLRRSGLRVRFDPSVTVVHTGNRSGAQRYGADRLAAYMRNTFEFTRARHGRLWTAAYAAVNGTAALGRYGAFRLLHRVRPGPRSAHGVALWRPYARFYLGRAASHDRPAGHRR